MGDRRAVFFDRDGTLIEDRDFLREVDGVQLRPGAAATVRAVNAQGVLAIVVTNQSGIGRGYLTEAEYAATARRLDELLLAEGARLDAQYHCPHHPEAEPPCRCRKPGPELYERAAARFGIDLAQSLYVGDRWRDVAPALALGGTGRLVPSPQTPPADRERADHLHLTEPDLGRAVSRFLVPSPAPHHP